MEREREREREREERESERESERASEREDTKTKTHIKRHKQNTRAIRAALTQGMICIHTYNRLVKRFQVVAVLGVSGSSGNQK
jgi:hypothetical protein